MLRTVSSLAILCALTAFPACGASDFPCGNTVTSSLPSPGGTRTAVLFERGCGAMTSRAGVGLSILEGGDSTPSLLEKSNVYLNDNQGSVLNRAPTAITAEWKADTLLVIGQHADAHVVYAAIRFRGVTIQYDTLR